MFELPKSKNNWEVGNHLKILSFADPPNGWWNFIQFWAGRLFVCPTGSLLIMLIMVKRQPCFTIESVSVAIPAKTFFFVLLGFLCLVDQCISYGEHMITITMSKAWSRQISNCSTPRMWFCLVKRSLLSNAGLVQQFGMPVPSGKHTRNDGKSQFFHG